MNKIIVLLTALTLALPAFSAEYLVKYRNNLAIQAFSSNNLMQIKDVHAAGRLMKVEISETSKIPALVSLVTNPNVEYVVPNSKMHAFSAPINMKALQAQWAIAKIEGDKAWTRAGNKGSKNVIVAVIDTGVDYNHQNLAPNIAPGGYNFVDNNTDPMDVVGTAPNGNPGHGTHCAGIIGASGVIDGGTTGISPDVSIMALRFLDQNASGDLNNGIKAIDYAISKKVQVISASWGAAISADDAKPMVEAIQRAEAAGIVFVVAASNDGEDNDHYSVYPADANLSNTISVAASDENDAKPSWSNYGKASVQLASPGDTIVSTLPGNKYGELSGTSMATPLVAGLVALIKAQDSNLTPMEIRALLQSTGAKVSIETACDCRIDAFNAIDVIKAKTMFVSPNAATMAPGDTLQFEGVYGKAPLTFSSSTPSVAAISATGLLTATAQGETSVTVTDASGITATSYKIYVATLAPIPTPTPLPTPNPTPTPGPNPTPNPGPTPAPGTCPLGDPSICQIACQLVPTLPFCGP